MTGTCEDCVYNVYDEEQDAWFCDVRMDEDEFYRVFSQRARCPYYRCGDEYELVRHQN